MLKLEENCVIRYDKYKICLSPFCFNCQNRVFQSDKSNINLNNHEKQQCAKWVISVNQFFQPITAYKLKELSNVELNFSNEPIQTLRKIGRLEKSDWKKQLTKELTIIKKQIITALQKMEANIEKAIQQVLNKKKFLTEINDIVEKALTLKQDSTNKLNKKSHQSRELNLKMNSESTLQLTQQLNKYFFQNGEAITQMKSVHFLRKIQMKEQVDEIKEKIARLQKKMLQEKNQMNSRCEQRIQFYEWIFKHEQGMFNKIQQISSLFGIKSPMYHIQGQTIKLNCQFCPKYVSQKINSINQKQMKKFMAQQLIIHFYNEHYDRVFYSYLKKVSKSECRELNIEQIFCKIEKIEELHLIDRQSGVTYTEDFVSTDIEVLDVLTKKNIHLAKNNFFLIEDRQALNSFITILVYQCWLKKKKSLIVSPSRFQHMNIISNIFHIEGLQVFKKFNGNEEFAKIQADKVKLNEKDPKKKSEK